MALIRNWRDETPRAGHLNAIIWTLLRHEDNESVGDPRAACLRSSMTGMVKHALQAGKNTDYHSHQGTEQIYYILRGMGKMLLGEEKYPVREGDVIYIPPETPHQVFNDGEDWMEHLIISCRLE